MQKLPKLLKKIIDLSADTRIFVFALFWLVLLLAAGTVSQRTMGLYQAQETFFSSFFIWLGPIPIPGGYLTMGVVFMGLVSKLVFHTNWKNKNHLGIIITHIGAVLLLFGGFLTAAFSTEGSMMIGEGGKSAVVRDYHKIELAVINRSHLEYDQVTAFADGWLKKGKRIQHADLPFTLEVLQYCRNCQIVQRKLPVTGNFRGMAQRFRLVGMRGYKEDSQNRAGITYQLTGAGPGADGIFTIFEDMSVEQTLAFKSNTFAFKIRHAERRLPFELQLIDFEKQEYPGTGMARSYKSVVNLMETGIKQRSTISMNRPLRHGGYTFYQSSFISDGVSKETTVLAVVDNSGRLFPYISSLIMCVGLLIHLLIKMPVLFGGGKPE